jgi:hypothetical protein
MVTGGGCAKEQEGENWMEDQREKCKKKRSNKSNHHCESIYTVMEHCASDGVEKQWSVDERGAQMICKRICGRVSIKWFLQLPLADKAFLIKVLHQQASSHAAASALCGARPLTRFKNNSAVLSKTEPPVAIIILIITGQISSNPRYKFG